MTTVRHFTATGFVVRDGLVALHWHPKVKAWLPPGGHVDENEDPVEAVLREIREETGIEAEVVSTVPRIPLDYPTQVAPPFTIMVEDIDDPVDGYHQHIDMIYFCRPVGPSAPLKRWMALGRPVRSGRRRAADLGVGLAGPTAGRRPAAGRGGVSSGRGSARLSDGCRV